MTKLATKRSVNKHNGDGRAADWIPGNRVKSFKVLFDRIRSKLGTYNEAREYIGLSAHTLNGLENGKISAVTGRKILEAYNRIK